MPGARAGLGKGTGLGLWTGALLVGALGIAGCGEATGSAAAPGPAPAGAAPVAIAAQAGFASGRVTKGDGSPLSGDIQDVSILLHGVSEAGEKVRYTPAVKEDGTWRQKLVPGSYRFEIGRIRVRYRGAEFTLPLEPVGRLWNKERDSGEGISQDFVWRVTGVTPYGEGDGKNPDNHTHWYGMNIGMRPDGYRNDVKKVPDPIPDGTRLVFTLVPQAPAIDGSTVAPVTLERVYRKDAGKTPDLNDLVPAPYLVSAVATLPDGSTRKVLIMGKDDYPGYKPSVLFDLTKDGILGTYAKYLAAWVLE